MLQNIFLEALASTGGPKKRCRVLGLAGGRRDGGSSGTLCVCVLLLQDLLQSCSRGMGGHVSQSYCLFFKIRLRRHVCRHNPGIAAGLKRIRQYERNPRAGVLKIRVKLERWEREI